jgi:hypothetical protein
MGLGNPNPLHELYSAQNGYGKETAMITGVVIWSTFARMLGGVAVWKAFGKFAVSC